MRPGAHPLREAAAARQRAASLCPTETGSLGGADPGGANLPYSSRLHCTRSHPALGVCLYEDPAPMPDDEATTMHDHTRKVPPSHGTCLLLYSRDLNGTLNFSIVV